MKRKGFHLPESPPSSSKIKITEIDKETAPSKIKCASDVSESEDDDDDVLSLSDIWCSFDEQCKVK